MDSTVLVVCAALAACTLDEKAPASSAGTPSAASPTASRTPQTQTSNEIVETGDNSGYAIFNDGSVLTVWCVRLEKRTKSCALKVQQPSGVANVASTTWSGRSGWLTPAPYGDRFLIADMLVDRLGRTSPVAQPLARPRPLTKADALTAHDGAHWVVRWTDGREYRVPRAWEANGELRAVSGGLMWVVPWDAGPVEPLVVRWSSDGRDWRSFVYDDRSGPVGTIAQFGRLLAAGPRVAVCSVADPASGPAQVSRCAISQDGGNAWRVLDGAELPFGELYWLAVLDGHLVVHGTHGSMWRSVDDNWVRFERVVGVRLPRHATPSAAADERVWLESYNSDGLYFRTIDLNGRKQDVLLH